jgi:hypothetical protein
MTELLERKLVSNLAFFEELVAFVDICFGLFDVVNRFTLFFGRFEV